MHPTSQPSPQNSQIHPAIFPAKETALKSAVAHSLSPSTKRNLLLKARLFKLLVKRLLGLYWRWELLLGCCFVLLEETRKSEEKRLGRGGGEEDGGERLFILILMML